MSAPVLQVIIASTRPGRVGAPVGDWIFQRAIEHGGFTAELVDLAAVALPMMDEPRHPRLRQYEHQHSRDWSATVDRADAFVFVLPEYNYGFNAPIKNAIDYLHEEWQYKPAGLVSYGGVSAGTRAAQMLKQVLTTLKVMPLPEAVSIPFVQQFLDADGSIAANDMMEQSATAMFDELLRWTQVLAPLRERAQAVPG